MSPRPVRPAPVPPAVVEEVAPPVPAQRAVVRLVPSVLTVPVVVRLDPRPVVLKGR